MKLEDIPVYYASGGSPSFCLTFAPQAGQEQDRAGQRDRTVPEDCRPTDCLID